MTEHIETLLEAKKEFKKSDNGKPRLELLEPDYLLGTAKVLSYGAKKYSTNNWKEASSDADRERIFGALLRHLMAYRSGEVLDSETGESHLYHASCNLMFLDYFDKPTIKDN